MNAAAVTTMPAQPPGSQPARIKRPRRSRQQGEEVARYFLAKEGSTPSKPELGEEVPTEGDALIKAFQTKSGVVYVLHSYKAEAEIQGGSPVLVKRPLQK